MFARDPESIAELRERESGPIVIDESSRHGAGRFQCVHMEPQTVALDEKSGSFESPKFTRRDVGRGIGSATLGAEPLDHRVRKQWIDCSRATNTVAIGDEFVHRREQCSTAIVETSEIETVST